MTADEDLAAEVESLRAERARLLATNQSVALADREREAAADRQSLASQLAYDRGVAAAGIDARLAAHDKHFAQINGTIQQTGEQLAKLSRTIDALVIEEARRDEAAATIAAASAAQVTGRQFVLGLAGLIVAMGGLLVAVSSGHP